MNSTGRSKFVDTSVAYNGSAPAIPCGLVAKSLFNDTYALYNYSNSVLTPVTINEDNIAWESDVKYKFKNIDTNLPSTATNWTQVQWTDMEDGTYNLFFLILFH